MSINRAAISGNLTRDGELRSTASGMPVLSFSVAVSDRRKSSQTGEWEDVPSFIDCTMFGTRAQSLSQYLSKGTKVSIEGKLRWSQWQDRDTGKNRSKIEVVVDEIELMQQSQQQGYQQPQAHQQAPQTYQAPTYQQAPQPAPQAPAQAYAPQQVPQMPPQTAPQAPSAASQQAPQAPMPQQPTQQPAPVYDADIPF